MRIWGLEGQTCPLTSEWLAIGAWPHMPAGFFIRQVEVVTQMRWCKLKVMCTNTVVLPYSISKTFCQYPTASSGNSWAIASHELTPGMFPTQKVTAACAGNAVEEMREGHSMEKKWTYLHSAGHRFWFCLTRQTAGQTDALFGSPWCFIHPIYSVLSFLVMVIPSHKPVLPTS